MNWYQAGVSGTGGVPSPANAVGDYVALPLTDIAHVAGPEALFGLSHREQLPRLAAHIEEARAIAAAMLDEAAHRDENGRAEPLTRIAALLDEIERDQIAAMRRDP